MAISAFMTDPRTPWEKIDRRTMRNGMKRLGIPYRITDTRDDLVNICMREDLTPENIVEFVPVRVKTPNGDKIVMHPAEKERRERSEQEEMLRAEEMERRLNAATENIKAEERAAAEKESQKEINTLKSEIAELTKLIKMMAGEPKQTDPAKMKYMAFKKWCKDRGHVLEKGEDRAELIAKLTDVDIPLSTD